jgi:hypothetical protein
MGIHLTKQVKGLYGEHYKTLKKEVAEDRRRQRYFPCTWIGRINVMKMAILLKLYHAHQNSNVALLKGTHSAGTYLWASATDFSQQECFSVAHGWVVTQIPGDGPIMYSGLVGHNFRMNIMGLTSHSDSFKMILTIQYEQRKNSEALIC